MDTRDSTLLPLPYREDAATCVEHVLELPGCIFFDSGVVGKRRGRYDIVSACPLYTLRYTAGVLCENGKAPVQLTSDQLIRYLNERLAAHHSGSTVQNPQPDLPFVGGFAGYFSYDLARNWQATPASAKRDIDLPEMLLGFYTWAAIFDHVERKAWLSFLPECPAALRDEITHRVKVKSQDCKKNKFNIINKLKENINVDYYNKCFEKIQDYIRDGDCYQVNYTVRFDGRFKGEPWTAYRELRELMSAPFGAYFRFGSINDDREDSALLSCSPERFVELKDGQVLTQPIKGTSRRDSDPEIDKQLAEQLYHSEKNRAENLMIVDLLRNDLGKCCDYGSIHTDKLFELQSTPSVHHLVSTVSGKLQAGKTAFDLLHATLPGGSITGAPKKRAMEIIEELEPARRSVYCGAIGYIDINGNMDSNVAIRTALVTRDNIYCWAGGGIVADSAAEAEHDEIYVKINGILNKINSFS